MKLQLEPTLTEIVRKPRRHRIPENLFLQLLIYIAVFAAVQLLEMLAMMPFLMDSVYAWSSQQIEESGAVDNTAMLSYLKALMMEPRNVRIMLFATAAGTIFVLFYTGVIEERRARTLGFHKKHVLPQYLLGLLAGFAAFSMVVGVDLLCGGLQFERYVGAFGGNLFLLLIGFLLQGMSEEVLCRGFIMTSTLRQGGRHQLRPVRADALHEQGLHPVRAGESYPLCCDDLPLCPAHGESLGRVRVPRHLEFCAGQFLRTARIRH